MAESQRFFKRLKHRKKQRKIVLCSLWSKFDTKELKNYMGLCYFKLILLASFNKHHWTLHNLRRLQISWDSDMSWQKQSLLICFKGTLQCLCDRNEFSASVPAMVWYLSSAWSHSVCYTSSWSFVRVILLFKIYFPKNKP